MRDEGKGGAGGSDPVVSHQGGERHGPPARDPPTCEYNLKRTTQCRRVSDDARVGRVFIKREKEVKKCTKKEKKSKTKNENVLFVSFYLVKKKIPPQSDEVQDEPHDVEVADSNRSSPGNEVHL